MNRCDFLAGVACVPGALMLPGVAHSAVHYRNSVTAVSYVPNFYQYASSVKNNLIQANTNWSNSCGPTSLLFALNYFYRVDNKKNARFTQSVSKVRDFLKQIYRSGYIGDFNGSNNAEAESWNHSISHMSELMRYANDSWGWNCVRQRQLRDSLDISRAIETLQDNGLVMFSFESTATSIHATNAEHLVLCYAHVKNYIDPSRSYFVTFEPYFGDFSYFYERDFTTLTAWFVNSLHIRR